MPLFRMTVEVFVEAHGFDQAERAVSKDLEGRPHSFVGKQRISEKVRFKETES